MPRHSLADMPLAPQNPPLVVEILIFPNVQLLDVAGPLQVFASANRLAREQGFPPPYSTRVVAPAPGAVTSSAGLPLVAEALPPPEQPVDTLIVCGGEGVEAARQDPCLVAWLKERRRRRIASVCTGAFLMGEAGLLDGRRAVTHWSYCNDLAAAFPAAQIEADRIHIQDGPVWTSAGVTAGIDMALALVEADLGRPSATAVARWLVVFARRLGGQTQFSAGLLLAGKDDRFDALHDWMRRNLRADLCVPELARQAGMSERTFLRRYRAATGLPPSRAVERMRVEAARQALGGGASIKQIARDCGFGSEETMRRSFLRHLSVAPQSYRERFPV